LRPIGLARYKTCKVRSRDFIWTNDILDLAHAYGTAAVHQRNSGREPHQHETTLWLRARVLDLGNWAVWHWGAQLVLELEVCRVRFARVSVLSEVEIWRAQATGKSEISHTPVTARCAHGPWDMLTEKFRSYPTLYTNI
jgi:hypothetical protein